MNRKFKIFIFILLVVGQIVIQRYVHQLKINPDLLYLILVYIAVTKGFYQSLLAGTLIGLITDYLSVNIVGVFGFSRTLAAYIMHESSRRIDLRSNVFIFLSIAVSLALSNGTANLFFYVISGYRFNPGLVLVQPLLTALAGLIIAYSEKAKTYLDVY